LNELKIVVFGFVVFDVFGLADYCDLRKVEVEEFESLNFELVFFE